MSDTANTGRIPPSLNPFCVSSPKPCCFGFFSHQRNRYT